MTQNGDEVPTKRRVELCPEEWADDFGEEFYEHTLENGFYYIAPNSEWNTQAKSVPAPGVSQYSVPTASELQLSMDFLREGMVDTDGQQGT